MKRENHENARFFIGSEVEHTPAFNKRTLFVVGEQAVEEIIDLARKNRCTHVYMGANHSFDYDSADPHYWDSTITALLDRGFWTTLDYPAHLHAAMLTYLNAGIWQSRIFVPMLRVPIAHVDTSHPNLTVKIDDVDFAATNPGVWCLHFNQLCDSNRFTDWKDYVGDELVGVEAADKPMPASVKKPVIEESLPELRAEPVVNPEELGLDLEKKSVVIESTPEPLDQITVAEGYASEKVEQPVDDVVESTVEKTAKQTKPKAKKNDN